VVIVSTLTYDYLRYAFALEKVLVKLGIITQLGCQPQIFGMQMEAVTDDNRRSFTVDKMRFYAVETIADGAVCIVISSNQSLIASYPNNAFWGTPLKTSLQEKRPWFLKEWFDNRMEKAILEEACKACRMIYTCDADTISIHGLASELQGNPGTVALVLIGTSLRMQRNLKNQGASFYHGCYLSFRVPGALYDVTMRYEEIECECGYYYVILRTGIDDACLHTVAYRRLLAYMLTTKKAEAANSTVHTSALLHRLPVTDSERSVSSTRLGRFLCASYCGAASAFRVVVSILLLVALSFRDCARSVVHAAREIVASGSLDQALVLSGDACMNGTAWIIDSLLCVATLLLRPAFYHGEACINILFDACLTSAATASRLVLAGVKALLLTVAGATGIVLVVVAIPIILVHLASLVVVHMLRSDNANVSVAGKAIAVLALPVCVAVLYSNV
jgi:hypothetical protein